MHNTIKDTLITLGLSTADSFVPFHPRVRDSESIGTLRCQRSGAIILTTTDHMNEKHYEEKNSLQFWNVENLAQAKLKRAEDYQRRTLQIKDRITDKRVLDFGCGSGGMLDEMKPIAAAVCGVELQEYPRATLIAEGHTVYKTLADVPDHSIDVVTMFHVLEHLLDPLDVLRSIKNKLTPGGTIVVEVPHANDIMIQRLGPPAFRDFIFWSEHLILHTRKTLTGFLNAAGFTDIQVSGYQRYPLANHLYWLNNQKPDGQKAWPTLNTPELKKTYQEALDALDMTDTLMAYAHA